MSDKDAQFRATVENTIAVFDYLREENDVFRVTTMAECLNFTTKCGKRYLEAFEARGYVETATIGPERRYKAWRSLVYQEVLLSG